MTNTQTTQISSPMPVRVVLPDPELWARARQLWHVDQPLPQREAHLGRSIAYAATFGAIGAVLWAIVTVVTETRLGILAMGLGVVCGLGARRGGPSRQAQWVGAVVALVACMAADYLTLIVAILNEKSADMGLSLPEFVAGTWDIYLAMQRENLSSMALVFLGFAVWEGYRIPRRS